MNVMCKKIKYEKKKQFMYRIFLCEINTLNASTHIIIILLQIIVYYDYCPINSLKQI